MRETEAVGCDPGSFRKAEVPWKQERWVASPSKPSNYATCSKEREVLLTERADRCRPNRYQSGVTGPSR